MRANLARNSVLNGRRLASTWPVVGHNLHKMQTQLTVNTQKVTIITRLAVDLVALDTSNQHYSTRGPRIYNCS